MRIQSTDDTTDIVLSYESVCLHETYEKLRAKVFASLLNELMNAETE